MRDSLLQGSAVELSPPPDNLTLPMFEYKLARLNVFVWWDEMPRRIPAGGSPPPKRRSFTRLMTTQHTRLLLLSLSRLLQLSSQTKSLTATKALHAHLLRKGLLLLHPNLHTKLALSYAACPKSLPSIAKLLIALGPNPRDPSPWNSLLASLSRHGFHSQAIQILRLMHKLSLPIDSYALCTALTAASAARAVELGRQMHALAEKSGWLSSVFVGGALVGAYAKSEAIQDAHQLFDEIPLKNTVCANALLVGYVESRRGVEGLSLLRRMHGLGLVPDAFTLSAILKVCADVPAVGLGMEVHAHFVRRFHCSAVDAFLLSSLVEMYGKCGLVGKARLVFELAGQGGRTRDVVLWTSMLNAYGRNGMFNDVIEAYEDMLSEGTEPDEIVSLALLSACSHSGNVIKGLSYFESMARDCGLVPGPEHYGCVVDMLCKAGELEKAWKFANEMVTQKKGGGGAGGDVSSIGVSVWVALLTACRDYGNVDIGAAAAQRALELDPGNSGIYVELSNLYARAGLWPEIGKLRELMKEKGLRKDVGYSRVELMD